MYCKLKTVVSFLRVIVIDVARVVHWDIAKRHGLPAVDKWYEHEPGRVLEIEKAKLLWGFSMQTDYEIQEGQRLFS